jgi:hypothetical protein
MNAERALDGCGYGDCSVSIMGNISVPTNLRLFPVKLCHPTSSYQSHSAVRLLSECGIKRKSRALVLSSRTDLSA